MEELIEKMMIWSNVTEEKLKELKQIPTDFGETLSWEYLKWVRGNPLPKWTTPAHVLYGSKDNLQSIESIKVFSNKYGATLTVMDGGEHWFHTERQTDFLNEWLMKHIVKQ